MTTKLELLQKLYDKHKETLRIINIERNVFDHGHPDEYRTHAINLQTRLETLKTMQIFIEKYGDWLN